MNFKFVLSRDLNLESRKYLQVTSTAQVGSFPSPRPSAKRRQAANSSRRQASPSVANSSRRQATNSFGKRPIPGSKSSFAIDFLLDYSCI